MKKYTITIPSNFHKVDFNNDIKIYYEFSLPYISNGWPIYIDGNDVSKLDLHPGSMIVAELDIYTRKLKNVGRL